MLKIKARSKRPSSHHQSSYKRPSSHHNSYKRPSRPISYLNDHTTQIAIGAAAGCVLGAVAALFLAPKKAKHRFTQELDNLYDHVSDVAEEYAHDALEKGQHAYQTAKNSAENIYSAASQIFSKGGKISNRNLLLGIVGAGLLGASAVYAYAQRSSGTHESFADKWKSSKWSEMASNLVDAVSSKLHEGAGSFATDEHPHPIQNVLDLAAVGLNLWQEIKKRR